jgi:carbonic anhydrase/acetyltransferase-like protein (isoleucine patch superfamily)
MLKPYEGKLPVLGRGVFIAENAVVIGDVEVGDFGNIWYNCVIRGDEHEIRIGARTNIQDGTIVHVTEGLYRTLIGANVTIGHNGLIHGCTLEDSCLIGIGAIVLDDAVVESGAIVAAGAVVTQGKRIPSGQVWAGCPARPLRDVNDAERQMLKDIPEEYCAQAAKYLKAAGAG